MGRPVDQLQEDHASARDLSGSLEHGIGESAGCLAYEVAFPIVAQAERKRGVHGLELEPGHRPHVTVEAARIGHDLRNSVSCRCRIAAPRNKERKSGRAIFWRPPDNCLHGQRIWRRLLERDDDP